MRTKIFWRCALILFITGVFTATLAAQSVELYPNAGGFWPTRVDSWGDNKFKSEGIYGLKGGVFLTENAELEGSFGYINHFRMGLAPTPGNINPAGTIGQPSAMGFLYDVNGAWNFGERQVFNARISPYFVAGVGGLTTEIRHGSAAFVGGGAMTDVNGNVVANPATLGTLRDGDT